MHLTPEILAATYDWLRALPPFDRWRMPAADAVEFRVIGTPRVYGQYWPRRRGKAHRIDISAGAVSHTSTLVRTMAHEMCHLIAQRRGERSTHGRLFRDAAARVCRVHGFDPKEF